MTGRDTVTMVFHHPLSRGIFLRKEWSGEHTHHVPYRSTKGNREAIFKIREGTAPDFEMLDGQRQTIVHFDLFDDIEIR